MSDSLTYRMLIFLAALSALPGCAQKGAPSGVNQSDTMTYSSQSDAGNLQIEQQQKKIITTNEAIELSSTSPSAQSITSNQHIHSNEDIEVLKAIGAQASSNVNANAQVNHDSSEDKFIELVALTEQERINRAYYAICQKHWRDGDFDYDRHRCGGFYRDGYVGRCGYHSQRYESGARGAKNTAKSEAEQKFLELDMLSESEWQDRVRLAIYQKRLRDSDKPHPYYGWCLR